VRTVVKLDDACFHTTLVRSFTVKSGKNPLASDEMVVVVEPPTTIVTVNGVVNVVSAMAYTEPVAERATVGGVVLKFSAATREYV
jgi:hypothetical protein